MKPEPSIDGTAWTPPEQRRGRGARSNASGRHEREARLAAEDGWTGGDEPRGPDTQVTIERARRIVTGNDSPDIPFDRSINPYRGCEHGCIYCYARPSHAHMGLSPGLDFESRLFAKPDAAERLRTELAHPRYECAPIAIGTNTDPYQPIEREREIMRAILQVLAETNHPVTITTKSHLITRDLDILAPMAERGLVKVAVSVTTLDRHLARRMEPRASTPVRRLEAVAALADAGLPTGIMVAPVIPGLTDHEIEPVLEAGARTGAGEAGWILLRLPREIKDLFSEWLEEEAPGRAGRVLGLLRQMRGGRLNDARFGERMRGEGPYAQMLEQRFRLAAEKLGFNAETAGLDTSRFTPPERRDGQLSLFG